MASTLIWVGIPTVVIITFLLFIGLVLARLYKRATREVSLVKTGAGGRKVIMDGGTIVIPLLHEVSPVNMKTLRLEVTRTGEASLITKDRMRVDVGVEFYISVNATEDGISRAAQTLGDRTFDVLQLRELIEGKLIDGLRAVAAKMTMDELHENRSDFVQEVQNTVSEDLLKNGLELESVSLTGLDQTPFENLDENNAFNAVGMRQLAEVIAESKKKRALIDAQAETEVRQSAMEAAKRKLEIDREEEEARLAQIAHVETFRAAQKADIAKRQSEGERDAEQARIQKELEVRSAEIKREEAIQSAEIAKERNLAEAEQNRQIVLAKKSEEESHARASADKARAAAVQAAEGIISAEKLAEAERIKEIAIIDALREAETLATKVRVEAEAHRDAAANRAESLREEANAEADAMKIKAEAKKLDLLADADGQRAIADAENVLTKDIVDMKVQLARLEALPRIVAEMVRPAEKIDSIKIHHVTGLHGGGASGAVNGSANTGSPVSQAFDAIGAMAVQMPALRKIGEELGVSMDEGLAGIAASALAGEIDTRPGNGNEEEASIE